MILIKYVLIETPEELKAYMEADETREKQRQAAAPAKSDTKEEAAANKRVPVLDKVKVRRGNPKYIYEITDTKGDKRIVAFTDIYRIFWNAGYTISKSGLRDQFDRDEKVSFGGFVAERRPK